MRYVYSGPTNVRIVYTAMHGVGLPSIREVLTCHGYTDFHPVAEQADPDPDFPTVAFPNPEEPGAMDLSLKLAQEIQADLILANDPDADRLCVAVPDGEGFRVLTGNDVGILLADELLAYGAYNHPLVATTIVSTSMLEKIADHYGAAYRETLTGSKWIAERSIVHQADGGDFVVGFEEALGYSVGHVVRDKDKIAALLLADIAARCRNNGISLLERLESVYRRHGLHLTKQVSLKRPGESGQAEIAAIMERFRNDPPEDVAGKTVVRRRDLQRCQEFDWCQETSQRSIYPKVMCLGSGCHRVHELWFALPVLNPRSSSISKYVSRISTANRRLRSRRAGNRNYGLLKMRSWRCCKATPLRGDRVWLISKHSRLETTNRQGS